MALFATQQPCFLREVVLREKPTEMIIASPKATVPVLVLPDGSVVDESLDIMRWALSRNDPYNWFKDQERTRELIDESDGPFKYHLDRYKYGTRYEGEMSENHRQEGLKFLRKLDRLLDISPYLLGTGAGLADIAIFPFIRQFANVDRQWFDSLELLGLQVWLTRHLDSDLFQSVMKKYPQWKTGDENMRFVV